MDVDAICRSLFYIRVGTGTLGACLGNRSGLPVDDLPLLIDVGPGNAESVMQQSIFVCDSELGVNNAGDECGVSVNTHSFL